VILYDPAGDWLFHETAVALTVELYVVSAPYADIVVKRYRESDEVRHCNHGMEGIPAGLRGLPFSKTYFLDYLERNPPGERRPPPPVREVTDEEYDQIAESYLECAPKGGFDKYAENYAATKLGGARVSRERARAHLRRLNPNLKPGPQTK
jgi:hypothetical protein